MSKISFQRSTFMISAKDYYDIGCNRFTVKGMPDMRIKENKILFGENGFDFKSIQKNALEKEILQFKNKI
jgi:hypothetical protein